MKQYTILFLLFFIGAYAHAQNTRVKWKQIIMGVNGQIAQVGTDGNGRWVAPSWVDTVYLRNDSLVVIAKGKTNVTALPNRHDFILDTVYNADGLATSITLYTHGAWITEVDIKGDNKNGSGWLNYVTDGDYTTIYYAHAPYGQIEYLLSGSGGEGNSPLLPALQKPIATAQALTPTSNRIQWSTVPDATAYELFYSFNGATFSLLQAFSDNILQYTHAGLNPSTIVYYQVRAIADKVTHSNSALSTTTSATTFGLPALAEPTPGSNPNATTNSITVTWSSVTNASGYEVSYSFDGVNWNVAGTTGANATSFTQTGLNAGTTVNYRIRAIGDNEDFINSPYSDVITATTDAAPALQATTVNIAGKTGTSVTIQWDDINNESGYEVQYSTDGISYQTVVILLPNQTQFTHSNLTQSTQLFYRVRGLGDGVNFSNANYSPPVSTTTNGLALLAAPTINAAECGPTCISINWTATANAVAYLLQISTDNQSWILLDEVGTDSTVYHVNGLEPSTTYYFRVQALADGVTWGNSPFGVDNATTDAEETPTGTTLATPVVTATATSSSQINATWTNVANESSYLVERSTDRVIWTTVATPAANVTSFAITGLNPSTRYWIRVQAIGNGTTFTSSGRGTNDATTQDLPTLVQTKHGALLTTTSTETNITGLQNLGLQYARTAFNGPGTRNTNVDYTAAGFKTLMNYNPAHPDVENTFTLSTDTADFACTLDSLLTEDGTTNTEGIVIINEPNNFGYWNTSAKNMLDMILVATTVAHEHGLKAYDGGITGDIMRFMVYEDYIKRGFVDSANDYRTRAFATGVNPANWRNSAVQGPKIRFLDTLLAGLKNIPTDGVNIHWYETVRDEDNFLTATNTLTFIQTAKFLQRATGKQVMTNEYGSNNNNTASIVQQQIDAVKALRMPYAFWYSTPDFPITNTSGALTPKGTTYKNKIAAP